MTEQSNYRTNRDLFSNHYLNDHLRKTEPWNEVPDADVEEAFTEIRDLWLDKEDRVDDYNEAQLERNFIRPIFDILGVPFEIEQTVKRNSRRPDYGFFASTEAADAAFDREDFYEESIAVADAKRWGRKLDTRGKEKRDFENPSYQIHRYLQETPTQWAVLTNGQKWRLYYGPTSHRLDSYYEIDLPELLDIVNKESDFEAFKEFYLFFRQAAFLPDQTGDCFLDDVYDESSIFAEELGEDLQENIYETIRVLAEGFLHTNDDLGEDDLDLIHDSSLIYLYRLIFVLYAESEGRDLLPTNNEIYSGSYSLNGLKLEVVEGRDATTQHYQTWQTELWDQLDQLFVLIDQGSRGKGIPKDDLYIPAYNGGLFRTNPDEDDSVESQFLSNYEAADAYLAEVIELLTRHEASEGEGKVFVDYSSLDERNLGSIYEGLLEYKLDVADEPLTVDDGEYSPAGEGDKVTIEEGDVYLRTDDGERKATGSYYTPEYVVEYIVDETLGPLVNEIREDMLAESARGDERGFAEEFADRVFDLTVLDPAMGSGHFPVNAVDYLAREIIDAQEQQDRQALDSADAEVRAPTTKEGELRDINWARRKVAQRCIYGVDVNPLATELAKVSLWLRTLAAEQPLAFLDHHLKTGNSLVGSDIEDVLSDGDEDATGDGQLTLQQSFDHTRQRAMEHVTDRFQDLLNIDNETLEDAKEMEAVYDDVRADPLYKKLLAMANVHTADAFGLDVPGDADERMARALHSEAWENIEEQDWFKSAQAMAEDQRFFHWELEFPMAFYDQEGERKVDAGFDAVIGNPPWAILRDEDLKDYLGKEYKYQSGKPDLYRFFLEQCLSVVNKKFGMITPNTWLSIPAARPLRKYIIQNQYLERASLVPNDAFEGVDANMITFRMDVRTVSEKIDIYDLSESDVDYLYSFDYSNIDQEKCKIEIQMNSESLQLARKIENKSISLGDISEATTGYQLYHNTIHSEEEIENEVYHSDTQVSSDYVPEIRGTSIHRYFVDPTPDGYIDETADFYRLPPKQFREGPRILIREITSTEGIVAAHVEDELLYPKSVFGLRSKKFDKEFLTAIINSNISFFHFLAGGDKSTQDLFPRISKADLESIAIPQSYDRTLSGYRDKLSEFGIVDASGENVLGEIAEIEQNMRVERFNLNLDLLDYIGNFEEGSKLPDIGLYQPASENILDATTKDYKKLQIERARTTRNGAAVTIKATARYKPEDEEEFEIDSYGYTETDFFEAFSLTNLSEAEAALIEAFVPVAVKEEVGGFRDNATKTNSLIDRLKGMTLPNPDDVADDLRRYIETKKRADELDEKIEKADQLIDEIVYDLYDLTDEEIEIVKEAVTDD